MYFISILLELTTVTCCFFPIKKEEEANLVMVMKRTTKGISFYSEAPEQVHEVINFTTYFECDSMTTK